MRSLFLLSALFWSYDFSGFDVPLTSSAELVVEARAIGDDVPIVFTRWDLDLVDEVYADDPLIDGCTAAAVVPDLDDVDDFVREWRAIALRRV